MKNQPVVSEYDSLCIIMYTFPEDKSFVPFAWINAEHTSGPGLIAGQSHMLSGTELATAVQRDIDLYQLILICKFHVF